MSSVTVASGGPGARPLRRDAERNRALIMAAARQVFAARGIDAGFDEIARVAGVGAATVYRRFPERADLVEALFEQDIEDVVDHLAAAGAHPDPWSGLTTFLRWAVEAQARNRGLAQVLSQAGRGHEGLERGRQRMDPLVRALVVGAQEAGRLRADVSPFDVLLPVTLLSQVGGPDDTELRSRLLTLLLDGLTVRRHGPTSLPGAPLTEADLAEVMSQGHAPQGRTAGRPRSATCSTSTTA